MLMLLWGVCRQIKIGHSSMPRSAVVENILGSIQSIVEHIPRKWKNVQGIHVKTATSVALPLYNQLPPVAGSKPAADASTKDAKANGKVRFKKIKTSLAYICCLYGVLRRHVICKLMYDLHISAQAAENGHDASSSDSETEQPKKTATTNGQKSKSAAKVLAVTVALDLRSYRCSQMLVSTPGGHTCQATDHCSAR